MKSAARAWGARNDQRKPSIQSETDGDDRTLDSTPRRPAHITHIGHRVDRRCTPHPLQIDGVFLWLSALVHMMTFTLHSCRRATRADQVGMKIGSNRGGGAERAPARRGLLH